MKDLHSLWQCAPAFPVAVCSACGYLVRNYTRLGLVTLGLVSVEQLKQVIGTQVAAGLVHCLSIQESALQAPDKQSDTLHHSDQTCVRLAIGDRSLKLQATAM